MAEPVILPNPAAVYGNASQQFDADQPVRWTASAGMFLNTNGTAYVPGTLVDEILYLPPNVGFTQRVVTGENASGEDRNVAVTVESVFPKTPHWPSRWKIGMSGVITGGPSRSGKTTGRVVGSGQIIESFSLNFKERTKAEVDEVITFWRDHYPPSDVRRFFYQDKFIIRASGLFVFDSEIDGEVASHNTGTFSLVIHRLATG